MSPHTHYASPRLSHTHTHPQGAKIGKSKRGDKLDALLARNDVSGRGLRTIHDEYNDEEVVLSKEELKMIMRIRKGQFPHVEVGFRGSLVCVWGGSFGGADGCTRCPYGMLWLPLTGCTCNCFLGGWFWERG